MFYKHLPWGVWSRYRQFCFFIYGIDDANISHSEPKAALEFSSQALDVVVCERVFSELGEGKIEASGGGGVCALVEFGGLPGELDSIHRV